MTNSFNVELKIEAIAGLQTSQPCESRPTPTTDMISLNEASFLILMIENKSTRLILK